MTAGAGQQQPLPQTQQQQVAIAQHDISSGRPITYFDPATGKPAGVTSAGGTFYSVGANEDLLFRTAGEAQQYASRQGQTGQLVGESDIPSSQYWQQKTAREEAAKAGYGGIRTPQALSPVGQPVPGSQLAIKQAYLQRGSAQWASEKALINEIEAVGNRVSVMGKGTIVTPGYSSGAEQLKAMEMAGQRTTVTIAPGGMFDRSAEINRQLGLGVLNAPKGKPIDVSGFPVIAVKPARPYIDPADIIARQEAKYEKEGFLPFTKEMTTISEKAFVPSLLIPTEKYGYERIKGMFTPNTESIASAYQELQAARAEYYLGMKTDALSVGRDIWGTIPVQAYAIGGGFKIGTVGLRLALGSGARFTEGLGLGTVSKTLLFSEKAVEPAVITGGAIFAGSSVYKGYQRGGIGEALGETAVIAESLPFAAAGYRQAGNVYSEIATGGMKINVPSGESIYPQIFSEATTPFKSEIGFIKSSITGLRTYVPSRAELIESTFGSKAPYKMEISEVKGIGARYLPTSKEDIYGAIFSERTKPFSYELGVVSGVAPVVAGYIPSKEDIYGAIFSERTAPFRYEIGKIKNALNKDISEYIPTKEQTLKAVFGSETPYKMEYEAFKGVMRSGLDLLKSNIPTKTSVFGSEKPYKMEVSELLRIKERFPSYIPSKEDVYSAIFSERTKPFAYELGIIKGIIPKEGIKARKDVDVFKKGITALKDMFSFRETVPLESLTRPEVITGKQTFPVREPGESIPSVLSRFGEQKYKLPVETTKGKYKGFHATAAPFKTEEIGAYVSRPSDVPGLYISSEVSPLFLRVTPEYSTKNILEGFLQSEPLKPTIYRLGFEDIGRLPKGVRTARVKDISQLPEGQRTIYQPAFKYLTTKAPKGKAFITPAEEMGKTEIEVVGTPGSKILEYPKQYRTEVGGRKIAITEADILRETSRLHTEETRTVTKNIKKSSDALIKRTQEEYKKITYRRGTVPGTIVGVSSYKPPNLKKSYVSDVSRLKNIESISITPSRYTALSERYTSPGERYITPSERYNVLSERPTIPGERYTALGERYILPGERYAPYTGRQPPYKPYDFPSPYFETSPLRKRKGRKSRYSRFLKLYSIGPSSNILRSFGIKQPKRKLKAKPNHRKKRKM